MDQERVSIPKLDRIRITRAWCMPTPQTFTMKPVKELLRKYVGPGEGWIDPFAGANSPAGLTNDLNPDMPTQYHLDAVEFCKLLPGPFLGLLFDPPYSLRQLKECYQNIGVDKLPFEHTIRFYSNVRQAIAPKIMTGGYAISFGWNSIGIGKKLGFYLMEILLICHGRAHNDTIVTVERKLRGRII